MSTGKKVLIIGPGFIGWEILDLLLAESYAVTGYVRRKAHAQAIEASGASSILGDLDDTSLITSQTLLHDIIIHTATADHLPSVEAVLEGITQRATAGKYSIFIHTSGTSVLNDDAHGAFKGDKIYHDNIRSEIDSVSDDAIHRPIDLSIVAAQKRLGLAAKMAIMIPPLIYGFNPKHGRLSIQIPTMTRFALKHGFAGYIGQGLPVESQIHVMDLARAYVVLLHYMEQTAPQSLLDNPYFFCENGVEASWLEVATEIGRGLHEAGKIANGTPREFPRELYADLFGEGSSGVVGLNSRSRAVRLRGLGWRPREKAWRESFLEDELKEILKEEGDRNDFKGYAGVAAK